MLGIRDKVCVDGKIRGIAYIWANAEGGFQGGVSKRNPGNHPSRGYYGLNVCVPPKIHTWKFQCPM